MKHPWNAGRLDSWFASACHGGPGDVTQETKNEPWIGAQPYISRGLQAADQFILNRPTEFFPGSTVVPFSPETQGAMGATANRAVAGSPVLGAAQDYTQDILTDPSSTPQYQAVKADVLPAIQGSYSRAGRMGGSAGQAESVARGLTQGFAPYAESAAARAPGLAREDYYDIDRLAGVGRAREAKAGEFLSDAMARHQFAQEEPVRRAQAYQSTISGLPIPISSTTRQNQGGGGIGNVLLPAAGLGLMAAGLPTAGGSSLGGSMLGK